MPALQPPNPLDVFARSRVGIRGKLHGDRSLCEDKERRKRKERVAAGGRSEQGSILCVVRVEPGETCPGTVPDRRLSQDGDPSDRREVWLADSLPQGFPGSLFPGRGRLP